MAGLASLREEQRLEQRRHERAFHKDFINAFWFVPVHIQARPGPGQARILIPEPFQPEQPSRGRAADLQRLNADSNTHVFTTHSVHAGHPPRRSTQEYAGTPLSCPFPPAFQAEHVLKAGGELSRTTKVPEGQKKRLSWVVGGRRRSRRYSEQRDPLGRSSRCC